MKLTTVEIWESDSWSGRELLNTLDFKRLTDAEKYVREYNSKNTGPTPEYYTYATITVEGD